MKIKDVKAYKSAVMKCATAINKTSNNANEQTILFCVKDNTLWLTSLFSNSHRITTSVEVDDCKNQMFYVSAAEVVAVNRNINEKYSLEISLNEGQLSYNCSLLGSIGVSIYHNQKCFEGNPLTKDIKYTDITTDSLEFVPLFNKLCSHSTGDVFVEFTKDNGSLSMYSQIYVNGYVRSVIDVAASSNFSGTLSKSVRGLIGAMERPSISWSLAPKTLLFKADDSEALVVVGNNKNHKEAIDWCLDELVTTGCVVVNPIAMREVLKWQSQGKSDYVSLRIVGTNLEIKGCCTDKGGTLSLKEEANFDPINLSCDGLDACLKLITSITKTDVTFEIKSYEIGEETTTNCVVFKTEFFEVILYERLA